MNKWQRGLASLVAISLALTITVNSSPKARAIAVADDLIVAAVAAVFLAACGITFAASGMSSDGIKEKVGEMLDEYLTENENGASAASWLNGGNPLVNGVTWVSGSIVVNALVGNKLRAFAEWVRSKYSITAGGETVSYYTGYTVTDVNGVTYNLWRARNCSSSDQGYCVGSWTAGTTIFKYNSSPCSFSIEHNGNTGNVSLYIQDDLVNFTITGYRSYSGNSPRILNHVDIDYYPFIGLCVYDGWLYLIVKEDPNRCYMSADLKILPWSGTGENSLSMVPSAAIDIPSTIPDGKSVELATGSNAESLDDALDDVLDDIGDGTLSATMDIADTQSGEVVDPGTETGEEEEEEPAIIDAVLALPQRVAEKVGELFIPDEEFLDTFTEELEEVIADRTGILTYPLVLLTDFVETVVSMEDVEPILRWNAIVYDGVEIIPAGQYNFRSAVSAQPMSTVYSIYMIVVKAILVAGFVRFLIRKSKSVFGGDSG